MHTLLVLSQWSINVFVGFGFVFRLYAYNSNNCVYFQTKVSRKFTLVLQVDGPKLKFIYLWSLDLFTAYYSILPMVDKTTKSFKLEDSLYIKSFGRVYDYIYITSRSKNVLDEEILKYKYFMHRYLSFSERQKQQRNGIVSRILGISSNSIRERT